MGVIFQPFAFDPFNAHVLQAISTIDYLTVNAPRESKELASTSYHRETSPTGKSLYELQVRHISFIPNFRTHRNLNHRLGC